MKSHMVEYTIFFSLGVVTMFAFMVIFMPFMADLFEEQGRAEKYCLSEGLEPYRIDACMQRKDVCNAAGNCKTEKLICEIPLSGGIVCHVILIETGKMTL